MANEDDDKLLVLPLSGETKKLTQVISNDTARDILETLASESLSASKLASNMDIPLTTVQYNLEKLIEVGLIKVENIKYSEKGKQVKLYAPVRRLIVVVPERTSQKDVMEALKKYLSLFALAFLGVAAIAVLFSGYPVYPVDSYDPNVFTPQAGYNESFFTDPPLTDGDVVGSTERGVQGWAWDINPALAFGAGAVAVIAVVAVFEVWRSRKKMR